MDIDGRTFFYDKNNITYMSVMNETNVKKLMQNLIDITYRSSDSANKDETKKNFDKLKKDVKFKGNAYIALSPDAKKGDRLDRTEYFQKIKFMKIRTSIDNGVVDGFESLTTPAGTFKCLKVSYRMKIKMFLTSETTYFTEWYAETVGLIRSIERDKHKKGDIVTTLVSVSIPNT